MTQSPQVFDLERKLADDPDGVYSRQITESIESDLRALRQRMDAGLAPEEFQRANRVGEAMRRAIQVVEKVWKREQGQV